ncbi:MAG: sterol desaturase family protein [Pseudomonadota bacterium]
MSENILANEPMIRLSAFLGVFLIMAALEAASPRRRRQVSRLLRWSNNLALVALDTAVLRIAFPILAVGAAMVAADQGWGVLSLLQLPEWIIVLLAVVLLDLAVYGQHVLFHHVPWFWRLHRMHHADLDFDVTTAVRFHPLEIMLSMLIKIGVVVLIGAPAVAVVIFEILLNATAMFNHANLRLPASFDRFLRLVLVTPDMHRVHHSVRREEANSNFGFNLSIWDRLFGTYRAQPKDGHAGMTIGIEQFRTPRDLRIDRLLVQPFNGPTYLSPEDHRNSPPNDTALEFKP